MLAGGNVALADGYGTFLAVVIIYSILTLLGKVGKAKRGEEHRRPAAPRPRPPRVEMPHPRQRPAPHQAPARSALQELLEALQGRVETPGGPMGRRDSAPLPSAEVEEEGRSLEVENRDEEAEAVVQRRIKEAEARNRARTPADHAAFDQQIRQQPDQTAVAKPAGDEQLRQAIIWREILGPPAAFRDR